MTLAREDLGAGVKPVSLGKTQITRNVVVPQRHPGRWFAIVVLVIIVFQVGQAVSVNPNFHWDVYLTYLFSPQVIRGVGWTLLLTIVAMTVAISVAGLLVI